jgi:hypothetical protein
MVRQEIPVNENNNVLHKIYNWRLKIITPIVSVADLDRMRMFLGVPDPLARVMDPDPAQDPFVIEQKS